MKKIETGKFSTKISQRSFTFEDFIDYISTKLNRTIEQDKQEKLRVLYQEFINKKINIPDMTRKVEEILKSQGV